MPSTDRQKRYARSPRGKAANARACSKYQAKLRASRAALDEALAKLSAAERTIAFSAWIRRPSPQSVSA